MGQNKDVIKEGDENCVDDVVSDVTRARDVIARVASRATCLYVCMDRAHSPEQAKL